MREITIERNIYIERKKVKKRKSEREGEIMSKI